MAVSRKSSHPSGAACQKCINRNCHLPPPWHDASVCAAPNHTLWGERVHLQTPIWFESIMSWFLFQSDYFPNVFVNNYFLTQKYKQGFKYTIIFLSTEFSFHFFSFNEKKVKNWWNWHHPPPQKVIIYFLFIISWTYCLKLIVQADSTPFSSREPCLRPLHRTTLSL